MISGLGKFLYIKVILILAVVAYQSYILYMYAKPNKKTISKVWNYSEVKPDYFQEKEKL